VGSLVKAVAASALLLGASARATDFDPTPWLADLEQARQAFHDKYANWDWVETEYGVKIDSLLDDAAARLRKATNESDAKAVFGRITSKLDDGVN
jgi:hypothetical protein